MFVQMKPLFNLLTGWIIVNLLTACQPTPAPQEQQMTFTINTFDAPITCISPSHAPHKLFIGLEDGCLIEKEDGLWKRHDIGSNHRIYDILEHRSDSLFIGTRDAGLKLYRPNSSSVESFYIKGKNSNYSVYSLAEDSLNQLLYIGTSNGFYQLNLAASHFDQELSPIPLGKKTAHVGVNKVAVHNRSLYIASDLGLYRTSTPAVSANLQTALIDSAINNLTFVKDTVYALLDHSVLKITPDKQPITVHKGNACFYTNHPNEWIAEHHALTFHTQGQRLTCELPNGISSTGKQIGLMGKNFLYLACKEQLYAFARHQNTLGSGNNVIAVSDKKSNDTIYFLTDDLKLHRYRFRYNQPDRESTCLGEIKGLEIHDDVIKLVEADKETLFLATSKSLFRIKKNRATCVLHFNEVGPLGAHALNNFNTLYYSTSQRQLYIGTRNFLGVWTGIKERPIKPIPLLTSSNVKDTVDAYVVGICEKEDSLFVATLNKGVYGRKQSQDEAPLQKLRDLSAYESTYDVIVNGGSLYLNTSRGLLNYRDTTLLAMKHVKSIVGVQDRNPNEGHFILYYHGLNFKGLEDPSVPIPQYTDLSFKKSCIAVNGRKAVLGCNSGLFLYNGQELAPILITEPSPSPLFGLLGLLPLLVVIAGGLYYWYHRQQQKPIGATTTNELPTIEEDLATLERHVKTLFDALDDKKGEAEKELRKTLKQACLNFADKYADLSQLSFMKRRGRDRYNITVLLFIQGIDANTISRVLDVDQLTVNRHKYNVRKEIEQLSLENEHQSPIINQLYETIKNNRK